MRYARFHADYGLWAATSIAWRARWGARVLRPGCNPGCSRRVQVMRAAPAARQRAAGQRIGKQARQESNLQPPVLERTPSNAGVEAFVDFQRLSSKPATPALLDNAGVGTNPGTEIAYGQNLRRGLRISRADVAHLMLRVLEQAETIKQVIGIAN